MIQHSNIVVIIHSTFIRLIDQLQLHKMEELTLK